jgi:hypothetical protein
MKIISLKGCNSKTQGLPDVRQAPPCELTNRPISQAESLAQKQQINTKQ